MACKLLVSLCGIYLDRLHWELGVSATGPPGKSQVLLFIWFCLLLLELMIFQPWVKVYKPLFILYFSTNDLRYVLMMSGSLCLRLFVEPLTIIMFLLTRAAWLPFCSRVYFVFCFNFLPINSYKLVVGHRPVESVKEFSFCIFELNIDGITLYFWGCIALWFAFFPRYYFWDLSMVLCIALLHFFFIDV